jgi:hypothetical protein
LSFLLPRDEEDVRLHRKDLSVVFGREEIPAIKAEALHIYTEVTSRSGAAKFPGGRTLRQILTRPGKSSDWWYHGFSFRDPESSDAFTNITHVLVVRAVAMRFGAKSLVLIGAPEGIGEVLRSIIAVEHDRAKPSTGVSIALLRGLFLRLRLLLGFAWFRYYLRRHYEIPALARLDVVFVSFWDVFFSYDSQSGGIRDPYFKNLPGLLGKSHALRTGYFAWLSPRRIKGRMCPLSIVLRPLRKAGDVVILQSFIRLPEVAREVFDFRPAWFTLRSLRQPEFRASMQEGGFNWLPLLRNDLLKGAIEAKIPQCRLVAIATERAALRFRPRASVSFLEHFPHARAHYEGMRRAAPSATNVAVQHAGLCLDKTFYFLHPRYEMRGDPDGCAVPRPEIVFAMGELGRSCFLSYGYSNDQVRMYGSPRYDHIRIGGGEAKKIREDGRIRILLACSLDVKTEIALVEGAALATSGMPQVMLRLRNHPLSRVDANARFNVLRDAIEVSSSPLAEDLSWADLIVFSYSTVADEAFLLGIPCWQWLPAGFDGSALVKAARIPRFGSVAALREAISKFQPSDTITSAAERKEAADQLFAPTDGGAANRIAEEIRSILAADPDAKTSNRT